MKEEPDKVIAIRTGLLVSEADGVHQLVHGDRDFVGAAVAEVHFLPAARHADVARAPDFPVEPRIRRNSIKLAV